MNSAPNLQNGTKIGPYTIVRLIATGGMGQVYQAREDRLNRDVALKIMTPAMASDKSAVQRFLNEGQTIALTSHPNLVSVYAVDQIDGLHVIAMAYIEGRPLCDIFRYFALSSNDAAYLMLQILQGMQALHQKNIVHRDLKPQNIIYQKDNVMKIVDFGIAKVYGDSNANYTSTGFIVGTVQYLAPEVAYGNPATAASDIWSAGAIFYEMMTGTPLLPSGNHMKVLSALAHYKVEFSPESQAWIDPEVQRIVKKMCAKTVEDRYKTVAPVISDLQAYSNKYSPSMLWQYQLIGKEIVNGPMIRDRLLKRGCSPLVTKRVMLDALHRSMKVRAQEQERSDKTHVVEDRNLETISDQSVVHAFKEHHSQIFRVHARRQFVIVGGALLGILALCIGLYALTQISARKTPKTLVKTMPNAVSEPETPAPAAPAEKVDSGKIEVAKEKMDKPASTPSNTSMASLAPASAVKKEPPRPLFSLQTVELKNSKLKMVLQFTERSPSSGEEQILNAPILSWLPISDAAAYNLQIASSVEFDQIVFEKTLKATQFKWNEVAPGEYFWRVQAIHRNGERSNKSEIGSISVRVKPPVLSSSLYTANRDVAAGAQVDNLEVKVEWQAIPRVGKYRLLASADPGFKNILFDEITDEHRKAVALPPGSYFVRVGALSKTEKPISEFSAPAKATFAIKRMLASPDLVSPPDNSSMVALPNQELPLVLFWNKVVGVDRYELQISASKEFSNILIEKGSLENRLILKHAFKPGTYFWRVRAANSSVNSPWSPARSFSVGNS